MAGQPAALFVTDATPALGGGHVMRSLSIAERLSSMGWHVALLCGASARQMVRQFAPGMTCILNSEDALERHSMLAQGLQLAVFDQPGDLAPMETALRQSGAFVLAIDDDPARRHDCDALLDTMPTRLEGDYAAWIPDGATTLLGPSFALLRPEFAHLRAPALTRRWQSPADGPIVVNFGATDPHGATVATLSAMADAGLRHPVAVIIGSAAASLTDVQDLVHRVPFPVELHIDCRNVAHELARASLAVCGAGVSSWERCCLGLPSIVIPQADNQLGNAKALAETGAATVIPAAPDAYGNAVRCAAALMTQPTRLASMARSAAALCDGRGAGRLTAFLHHAVSGGVQTLLRLARPSDVETIYGWQCQPEIRRFFRNPQPPSWDEHVAWFGERLINPACSLNIIMAEGRPAGVLRLDFDDDRAEVSILVAPEAQGRGIGRAALAQASYLAPRHELLAVVHADNHASRNAFLAAGFMVVDGETLMKPAMEKCR